jgi:hypothetical protein
MVEGQQHVLDRRTIGHGNVSLLAVGRLSSSHETADLSTLWRAKLMFRDSAAVPAKAGKIAARIRPYIKRRTGGMIQPEFTFLAH